MAVPGVSTRRTTSPRQVTDLVKRRLGGRTGRPAGGSVTKSGLNAFTESLRQELVGERVPVSVVEPGTVETELVNHLKEITREAVRHQFAGIEALRPEDIPDAIVYIVTRERRIAVNQILVRAGTQPW